MRCVCPFFVSSKIVYMHAAGNFRGESTHMTNGFINSAPAGNVFFPFSLQNTGNEGKKLRWIWFFIEPGGGGKGFFCKSGSRKVPMQE